MLISLRLDYETEMYKKSTSIFIRTEYQQAMHIFFIITSFLYV